MDEIKKKLDIYAMINCVTKENLIYYNKAKR